MTPLTQAISQGFSSEQIIEYLLRHFPKYSKQIHQALGQGFSANQVVKYLSKGRKGVNEFEGELTEHEKTRKSDIDKQRNLEKNIGKGALALGAVGLGAYGLSRGAQSIAPEILPAIQQQTQQKEGVEIDLTPQITHQPRQLEQQPPNQLIQQAKQPQPKQSAQEIPQSQNAPTPPKINPQNTLQLLEKYGFKKQFDQIENKTPETLEGISKFRFPKEVNKFEKETGIPFQQAIGEYLSSIPQQTQQTQATPQKPEITPNAPSEGGFKDLIEQGKQKFDENMISPEIPGVEIPEKPKFRAGKLDRGSTVLLPDGAIGEIQDIRQGIASVNAEGKIRRKKLEELIESPLPEKELNELYKDVISGIQKKTGQEVSRMVNWAGYDPKTNELAFIPHLGSLYVYDDISPEDAKELTNILSQRKTSGENFIGAWGEGTQSPIGAAMSKLIQKLQKERGGKGSEYKGKYEKIYDALEPAKIEAKKKFEEKKAINREEKQFKNQSPKTKNRKESEIIDERLDKEYDRLMKLDEEIRLENRSGKQINVKIRSEKIKKINALKKSVDDLRSALHQAFIDEKQDKELENEKRKAQKPRAS